MRGSLIDFDEDVKPCVMCLVGAATVAGWGTSKGGPGAVDRRSHGPGGAKARRRQATTAGQGKGDVLVTAAMGRGKGKASRPLLVRAKMRQGGKDANTKELLSFIMKICPLSLAKSTKKPSRSTP